jgi:HPt (histidine-containing phosphotransfer) domain-containing protein
MKLKFSKMIEYYLEDSLGYVSQILEALANDKPDQVVPAAHTLKSSSRQMGGMRLASIAKDFEAIARESLETPAKLTGLKSRTIELQTVLDETLTEFKKLI